MLAHDGSSRLIGSGLTRPSKDQSGVLQVIDNSVAGSMTAQPPGFRPSALRVTTNSQQVASLGWGSYPSAKVQSAYSSDPADRATITLTAPINKYTPNNFFYLVLELWEIWSTSSLPILPGPLWSGELLSVRIPSIAKIELFNHLLYLKPFNCVQTNDWC